MVDGYEGYEKSAIAHKITRLGCWAHARRKFVEAQSHQPKSKIDKADQAIAYIQKLYALEKMLKDDPPDKRYQLNEYEYLRRVFKERPNAQSIEHWEALLPWNVQLA